MEQDGTEWNWFLSLCAECFSFANRSGGAGSRSGEQTFGLFQSHSKWGEFFLVILEGLLVGRRIVLILCIIVKRHQGSCQKHPDAFV